MFKESKYRYTETQREEDLICFCSVHSDTAGGVRGNRSMVAAEDLQLS